MEQKDFPCYFIAGDNASLKAQKYYLRLFRLDLILMCIASIATIYSFNEIELRKYIYYVVFFSIAGALITSLILKVKRYEDIWYRGRALAESCKTLTWRYVTCSEFFENTLTASEAKKRFISRIKEISNQFQDISKELKSKDVCKNIITDKMIENRLLPVEEREKIYLKERVEDQLRWYSTKSELNKKKYSKWFWIVIILQIITLICAFLLIENPESNFNWVSVLTTFSASGLSWLQVKNYQENKEAYLTATSELNLILADYESLDKSQTNREIEFSKFVLDAENAMSREHTMWLAQKRK
ncbi:DUF4231 domain-containing protein [Acinetobacter sp. YH12096]|uniref:DUF4231 domain-containing protein n=1 Tax=Acinetobacter sp. YH12096 TaxID=2601085 RepID=UPI0015D3FF30|nr:DUF4231 domain-containing protein [Acinetobacter sp. YH12096]